MTNPRIVAEEPAIQLIRQLVTRFGPLEFRISGSCVEGFVPHCIHGNESEQAEKRYPYGMVEGCPVYILTDPPSGDQSYFVLSIQRGKTTPGSLEAPGNVRFSLSKKVWKYENAISPHMFSYLFGYSGNWG